MTTPRAQEIALVCLDIAGTLTEGSAGPPLPGAVAAVRRLADELPVRFVTNVTSCAGLSRSQLAMVGDDAEFDASASTALGLHGVLVRTGKYRPGDEERVDPPPTAVIDSIADLPAWLGLQD